MIHSFWKIRWQKSSRGESLMRADFSILASGGGGGGKLLPVPPVSCHDLQSLLFWSLKNHLLLDGCENLELEGSFLSLFSRLIFPNGCVLLSILCFEDHGSLSEQQLLCLLTSGCIQTFEICPWISKLLFNEQHVI